MVQRLEDGGGVARDPVARAEASEDVLVVAARRAVAAGRAAAWVSRLPSQRNEATTLAGRDDRHGLVDQAGDLGPDLALEEPVEHGPACGHGERAVVDGQEEGVVALHQVGDGV